MKRIILLTATLTLIVFVVFLVVMGVSDSIERAETEVVTIEDMQQEQGVPVVTTRTDVKDMHQTYGYTGVIKGVEQADVTSAVQIEKVLKINVKPGARVDTGDLMITLDTRTMPSYRTAKESLEDSKRDYERTKELYDAGAVSKQTLDKALMAYEIARANMDSQEWQHRVVTPIAGTVTDVFVENGQTVMAGTPLARVAQLGTVITEIHVAETDLASIREGQQAAVTVSTYPDRTFDGKVSEISLSTDPAARSFKVEVAIPNPDRLLKPGMFTSVDIVIDRAEQAVTVPVNALVDDNGSSYLYVVNPGNTVRRIPVETGIEEGGFIQVTGEIDESSRVVVQGHNKLSDGAKIQIVNN